MYSGPTGKFVADTCAPLRDAGEQHRITLNAFGRGNYPGTSMDPNVLPQIASVGSWVATNDQDWGLGWHRNEGIEFTCVSAGSVDFSCEDHDYDLVAGNFTVTRPWQLHRIGRPNISSSSLTWFIIDVDVRRPNQEWVWPSWLPIPEQDLARLTELLSQTDRHVWRANKELLAAVSLLERALRGDMSQTMARIATAISSVLIELRDLLEEQSPILTPYLTSTERTVKLLLSRLTEHLDEPWTVDQMAAECGLGRTRFMHYCKQMLTVPPMEYLNTLRINRAIELLTKTELRVTDIAHMCGFQSGQYLATAFRRRMNCTPIEFRRQHVS